MYKTVLMNCAALALAIAAGANMCSAAPTVAPGDTVGIDFSHPDRIRYDGRSLIIEGKPFFLYSGAIHYFRCPKELWKDRLQKLKDAGLNCVETYLAWDIHEPDEPAGPDDFSKIQNMQDISDFIQTAQDLGLYVIIRPGPYICAEWDRGGLPGWLMKHKPGGVKDGQFLRGNSPEMLAWDKHWIAAAAKVVRPHLITNLPPGTPGVILWQLENEYDYAGLPSELRADVLRTLAHAAIDNGIDVPLFTCETTDKLFREDAFLRSHVYDTANSYRGFDMHGLIDDINKIANYQPEKFHAITELQGGWFAQVGGKLSDQQGHNAAQINQFTLTAIERGVTSMNYYMFYGGSNFGYGAAQTLIQSYDYNAPLREWGGIGDRYLAVKAIAQMLKDHGDQLVHSDAVDLTVTNNIQGSVSFALRRSLDGSQFYFIRNAQQSEPRTGTAMVEPKDGKSPKITLTFELGNFGAKILYLPPGVTDPAQGEWLPKPVSAPTPPAEPMPGPVAVTVTSIRPDGPSEKWLDVADGKRLDSLNIYDQRYVTYRVNFDLTADDLKTPLALRVRSEGGGDSLTARINGKEITVGADKPGGSHADAFPLAGIAHEGQNTAEILFENVGCANGGAGLEQEQGISQVSLIPLTAQQEAINDWRMKIITGKTSSRPEVIADFDDHDWKSVSVDGDATITTPKTNAVYRGTLNVTKEQIAAGMPITFGCIDDSGTLFVNGQRAGMADTWEHPWTFDITSKLHEGRNLVAVIVKNVEGGGGLYKGCYLDPVGKPLSHLQVAPEMQSMAGGWSVPKNSGGGPAAASAPNTKMLSWYNLQFELPERSSNLWAPWHLHLEADANAFVYLNGHLLGRYWAVGPQRDIWLPDCWLNFGQGVNIISLQTRPTNGGDVHAVIKSAEVRPYTEYAMPVAF